MAQVIVPEMCFLYDYSRGFGSDAVGRNSSLINSLDDVFTHPASTTVTENTFLQNTVFFSLAGYQSTGLLLTPDGWIATAAHCIELAVPYWDAQLRKAGALAKDHPRLLASSEVNSSRCYALINGKHHAIDPRYYAMDREHDIAIVKVIGNRLCPKIRYPWKESRAELFALSGMCEIDLEEEVVLYSAENNRARDSGRGKVVDLSREVITESNVIHDAICTNVYTMPGSSGGAVTTLDNELIGFTITMNREYDTDRIGTAKITKADYLVLLIAKYVKFTKQVIAAEEKKSYTPPVPAFTIYTVPDN